VKLLDFFGSIAEGMCEAKGPEFSTGKTQQESKTVRECRPATPEWMKQWDFLKISVLILSLFQPVRALKEFPLRLF
jgi:hypothetical protein